MPTVLKRLAIVLVVLAAGSGIQSSAAGGAAATATARENAVSWAEKQVGTREVGKTNCSPVIDGWQRDMRLKVPPCRVWCGAFVHQAFHQAGVRLSERLIDPHRSYQDAVAGRRGLRAIPIARVRRGDIVFFFPKKGEKASHVSIARARPRGGRIATVDGNTSDAVRLQRWDPRFIVLAARVTGDA